MNRGQLHASICFPFQDTTLQIIKIGVSKSTCIIIMLKSYIIILLYIELAKIYYHNGHNNNYYCMIRYTVYSDIIIASCKHTYIPISKLSGFKQGSSV